MEDIIGYIKFVIKNISTEPNGTTMQFCFHLLSGSSSSFFTSSGRFATFGARRSNVFLSTGKPGTSAMEMIPSPLGPSPSSIFPLRSLSLSLRSEKGMETVRTDGGGGEVCMAARQRHRTGRRDESRPSARASGRRLPPPRVVGAQPGCVCVRTRRPISISPVTYLGVGFVWDSNAGRSVTTSFF